MCRRTPVQLAAASLAKMESAWHTLGSSGQLEGTVMGRLGEEEEEEAVPCSPLQACPKRGGRKRQLREVASSWGWAEQPCLDWAPPSPTPRQLK